MLLFSEAGAPPSPRSQLTEKNEANPDRGLVSLLPRKASALGQPLAESLGRPRRQEGGWRLTQGAGHAVSFRGLLAEKVRNVFAWTGKSSLSTPH